MPDQREHFSISDSSVEGILDPLTIEQVGYTPSGTISARTDTDYNTAYSMFLDDTHGWLGSRADIQVSELMKLYVLNGTLSEGTDAGDTFNPNGTADYYPYGWSANSTSGEVEQVQRVRYENTGDEYILVENKAKPQSITNPQHQYTHFIGTTVYWNQSIDVDSTSDFILSFDYLYKNGPVDGTGPQTPSGTAYVEVIVDGTVIYSISLKDLTQREYWYSTGEIPISMSVGSGPVDFKIGITINGTFLLDADDDYDSIPGTDGADNSEFISVYFDDVSFKAADAPSFEQVNLQYNVEGDTGPILGSDGTGSASITKSDYWTTDPVSMHVTSNTTVSFNYEVHLLSHRFSNSTWNSVITNEGAQYIVNLDESPQIQFHTYIGFLGDYENLTTRAWFPSDWDNVTVRDPFLDDVTSSCTVSGDMVEIPTSLMSLLGWWTFHLESPNYLESIELQKFDPSFETWGTETIYRSGNHSRAAIEIGTLSETPDPLDLVNVTWHLPNGTEWASDSDSGGIAGIITSTPHTFGSLNTSAGLWLTCVSWHNGSEIAFGSATFEVHHTTDLTPLEAYIELESGDPFTNFVYFTDAENGEFLLDPSATVTANWSVSTVPFGPDAVYNRWTGSFDTSLIGPGDNLVIVTANLQYYDEATCTFIVHTSFSNNELEIDNPPTEVGLGDTFLVTFQYLDQYGTGIPDANVGVTFTGPTDGLSWLTPVNVVDGNYSVAVTAEHSGSYAITISAEKDLYGVAEDTLFVLVGEISTTFTIENGSAAVIRFGEDFRLVVRYVNGTGHGLDSADVAVASMTPSTGLDTSATTPLGNGYFSILLTPQETNTFTLLLNASLLDHQIQFKSFTITATTIGAQLTAEQSSEVITTDQSCIVTLNLTSELYGQLDGATVLPYNPPSGLGFSAVTPLGGGLYTVTVSSTVPDSYQIVFIAYAANHNDATTSIPLGVIVTPTKLRISDGLPSASVEFSEEYDLLVFFERTITPSNITGATIQVNFTSFETLDWIVIPLAEGYIIRFTTDQVGRWDFTVIASKTDFQPDDFEFTLFINEIGTDLSGFSPSEPLSFGQSFTYTFHYYLLGNQSAGISGASVFATGSGSDWFTTTDLGNGYYNITVETEGLGRRVVEITFQKTGYQDRSTLFDFVVNPTLVVIDVQSIYWDQFQNISLTLHMTESGTGNLITNATVTFALYYDSVEEVSGIMEEVSPGLYAATFSGTWRADNGFDLRVFIVKENHALAGDFHSINIVPVPDPAKEWELYVATVVPQIGAVAAIAIVAIIGQITYSRRKKSQLAVDMVNKRRFDDADNIIGVIVMHKASGIPIYSRIVKGGFEEGIVAAFISAVTHFREEFEMLEEDAVRVIPISDIIRAVQTRNLICAFVTVRSASVGHNRKMESFAMQVGTYLDDLLEDLRPSAVLDDKIAQMLHYIFDTTMDGSLNNFYKIATSGKFPRKYRPLEILMLAEESKHCSKPILLSRGVASFGVTEARGCTLVLEAIEKELIAPCEEEETLVSEINFA
ncbi:MAG: hypothetical protein RTV41_10385, partial [Candidatus Thorarchaeota archaeon]